MTSVDLCGRDPADGRSRCVRVVDGVVSEIVPGPPTDVWLVPGLIDLQVNGFGGHDVNGTDSTVEDVVAMVHALFRHGVTTVVPTVITASEEEITEALRRVVAAREADPLVRHAIPYVHVEGPHLSPEDGPRGVHPLEHIRPPDAAEFERWQRAAEGLVGMVTLSPHWDEAPDYIATLATRDVLVAIGHTQATPEQIRRAAEAGARLSTHLGNGAHATLPRHPHYIWAQLADDRLDAGFIADGHHLPDDTLTAMLRAKGLSRSFLVSDATALAGLAPGRYRTPVGGEVELSDDGRLSHVGTPYLAGAARPVSDGVGHVAALGPFTLAEAVDLATVSPGRFCGGRGTIRVGAPADLLTFRWSSHDPTLRVAEVCVGGALIAG